MKLQILVNHYKENETIVERFLSSLAMQKGVEFDVLLYGDGGLELTQSSLTGYPFNISYKYLSHTGVCHTRNLLMDDSSADYIMFCDIDDCFSSFDGLASLMAAAEATSADVIGSPYQSETIIDGEYQYTTMKKDMIRVHGKIFRREYLYENNIRFPDELETSGDMSFLWLAYALTKKIVWVHNNFYIWKSNPDSVTRSDRFSNVKMYPRTLRCYTLLSEELQRRNLVDLYNNLISTMIPMMYLDMNFKHWNLAPADYKESALLAIKKYLEVYYTDYKSLDIKYRKARFDLMSAFKKYGTLSGNFEGIEKWAKEIFSEKSSGILIIGNGVVGSNLSRELVNLEPHVYDKYKPSFNTKPNKDKNYEIAFVCVDTPKTSGCDCSITEVKNAIMENNADIFVIKSTVLPGTTERLREETGKRIVFSPEYYGGTQHCNNYDFNFTILGGEKDDCVEVVQVLQKVYDARHQFRITDSKTAELAKYMENSYLAMKVSFCNQFYEIAEKAGVCYEELRELFVLDPRVEPAHTFVYRDHPWWSSHCLDKDVPAIANAYDAKLLQGMIDYNDECKAGTGCHKSKI